MIAVLGRVAKIFRFIEVYVGVSAPPPKPLKIQKNGYSRRKLTKMV